MSLFEAILKARGITGEKREAFLKPDYNKSHDPFKLPDMESAVDRLVEARNRQDQVTGDYDIDGLTATTVLIDSFKQVPALSM